MLTIRGEKRSTARDRDDHRYHVIERTFGRFSRSFQLPRGVDADHIEAEFTDGLLLVRVRKATRHQPRRIEIRDASSRALVQGTPSARDGHHRSNAPADGRSQARVDAGS